MNRVIKIIKRRPLAFLCYGISFTVLLMLQVGSAVLLQQAFNIYSGKDEIQYSIGLVISVLIFCYFGRGITSLVLAFFEGKVGFLIDEDLKKEMLAEIFECHGAKYGEKTIGEITSIFRDDVKQVKTFVLFTIEITFTIFYALVIFLILFRIHVSITLIVFLPTIIVTLVIKIGYSKLSTYGRIVRKESTNMTSLLGELLNANLAIRIAGAQNHVVDHFNNMDLKQEKASIRENVFKHFLRSVNTITFKIGEGLVLLLAFQLIRNGEFTIGDFAAFTFLISSVADIVSDVSNYLAQIPLTKVSFHRIEEMMIISDQ